MPLVEIDDEDMRVLFNLTMCCHTSHLRVHVYLAIFNLLAKTASSLQVLDMPLVEIDDEDMKVLFNLAMRCHTLRICKSMKIYQTLPFLKVTIRPRLQGRLHCRYHPSFNIVCASCIMQMCLCTGWNKNPTLSQNHNLPTDPPTYRISYLPMCFFSYLPGSCTYFLISCFLTTHLTYLLTISLKNHPLPTYLSPSHHFLIVSLLGFRSCPVFLPPKWLHLSISMVG